MKLSVVLLVAGAIGLTASVGALQSGRGSEPELQTTYYASGHPKSESAVEDGRKHGLCRRWYADGTKMAEGAYRDGEMEGRWTCWLADGSIDAARSGVYRAGERVSD